MRFQKKKEYLVCIDSDGCAIDTMTVKHEKCFGPFIIEVWQLEEYQEELLAKWNTMNLYSITRGINRFKGVGKLLEEVNLQYTPIEGLEGYTDWLGATKQFSNDELEVYIGKTDNVCAKNVLKWSLLVNRGIAALDDSLKVSYQGCLEALQEIEKVADIAVVSSANVKAVTQEWEQNGLLTYVGGVFAQDVGTKSECIRQLISLGYETECVVKIGDALGDLEAAQANEVNFYPILVSRESESWKEFATIGLQKLVNHEFSEYAKEKEREFYEQFKGEA